MSTDETAPDRSIEDQLVDEVTDQLAGMAIRPTRTRPELVRPHAANIVRHVITRLADQPDQSDAGTEAPDLEPVTVDTEPAPAEAPNTET